MGGFFGEEGGGDTFLFEGSESSWQLAARLESAILLDERLWFGQSVTFLGDGLVVVGEMDPFGLGGGKLFLYDIEDLDDD